MDNESQKEGLRVLVRGAYDIQKLRIQMGNRICSQFRHKVLGLKESSKEETDADAKKVLDTIRVKYKKLTDGVMGALPSARKFKGDDVISTYTEAVLIDQYMLLESDEARHFRRMGSVLEEFPIYTEYLKDLRGVGPAIAGVIIGEIDIHKAKYASSIWKFCGLDVAQDGKGRSRRKEHLVEVEYTDADGNLAKRTGITFSPFIKTKLMGVLSTSLLRSGNEKYRAIYDGYKHRLEHRPDWAERTKLHRHNAALRYMIKQFLVDLYVAWREIEGLEVFAPYAEAKLGLKHAS